MRIFKQINIIIFLVLIMGDGYIFNDFLSFCQTHGIKEKNKTLIGGV
jgi:hypothetical protein